MGSAFKKSFLLFFYLVINSAISLAETTSVAPEDWNIITARGKSIQTGCPLSCAAIVVDTKFQANQETRRTVALGHFGSLEDSLKEGQAAASDMLAAIITNNHFDDREIKITIFSSTTEQDANAIVTRLPNPDRITIEKIPYTIGNYDSRFLTYTINSDWSTTLETGIENFDFCL